MARISQWLKSQGLLFVHIFVSNTLPYHYQVRRNFPLRSLYIHCLQASNLGCMGGGDKIFWVCCTLQVQNEDDWMAKYFFTGGTMPSQDLLLHFQVHTLLQSAICNADHVCERTLSDLSRSLSPACSYCCDLHAAQDNLAIQQQWYLNGKHYSRTLEDWLKRMDAHKREIIPLFRVSHTSLSAIPRHGVDGAAEQSIGGLTCAESTESVR